MTDSANLLYIAIVSDTEPQNTWERTQAMVEEPAGYNTKGRQLCNLVFNSGCNN